MGIKLEKLKSWATSTDLKFMVLVIGPEEAEDLLGHNDNNRPVSDLTVAQYAQAMDSGNWALTGEALIFADTGRLLNGQHRLLAVLRSKSVIETVAIFGISEEAFGKIDSGRKRSVGDLLAERGVPLNTNVAAAISSLCQMKAATQGVVTGNLRNYVQQDKLVCVAIGVDNQQELVASAHLCNQHSSAGLVNSATIAVLACMIAIGKESMAKEFIFKISSGEGIVRGDPEYAFRSRVLDAKMRGTNIEPILQMGYLIKCAIAKMKGAKLVTLRLGEGEPFPIMPGLDMLRIPTLERKSQKFRHAKG